MIKLNELSIYDMLWVEGDGYSDVIPVEEIIEERIHKNNKVKLYTTQKNIVDFDLEDILRGAIEDSEWYEVDANTDEIISDILSSDEYKDFNKFIEKIKQQYYLLGKNEEVAVEEEK